MVCCLCKLDRELKNSHILPEFFYKPMYDNKHRFFALSPDPNERNRILRKGLREKLPCCDCEQKLSMYEKYVRDLLYGGVKFEVSQDRRTSYLTNVDYKKVRIFYISVLWRMSIASLEFFKNVNLGQHEEKLRIMILNENPGEPDQYGFLCFAPLFDDNALGDWLLQPDYVRLQQHRVYRALIGGLLYLYFVSSHNVSDIIKKRFVQKNGDWFITAEKIRDISFLDKTLAQLSKAQKSRKS